MIGDRRVYYGAQPIGNRGTPNLSHTKPTRSAGKQGISVRERKENCRETKKK